MTHSLRTSVAWSMTHCTMPEWSRRSTKARCSPCSRRRATQPHSRHLRADVGRAQHAAQVRAHGGGPVRVLRPGVVIGVVGSRSSGRSVGGAGGDAGAGRRRRVRALGERGVGEEALELVHNGSPGHGALLVVAAQRPQPDRSLGHLLGTDHQRHQRTRAVGRLDLGLHGAAVEGPVGPQAGPAQLGRQRRRPSPRRRCR